MVGWKRFFFVRYLIELISHHRISHSNAIQFNNMIVSLIISITTLSCPGHNDCQNKGVCINGRCFCVDGWLGDTCEMTQQKCNSKVCNGRGRCIPNSRNYVDWFSDNSVRCECERNCGWKGTWCLECLHVCDMPCPLIATLPDTSPTPVVEDKPFPWFVVISLTFVGTIFLISIIIYFAIKWRKYARKISRRRHQSPDEYDAEDDEPNEVVAGNTSSQGLPPRGKSKRKKVRKGSGGSLKFTEMRRPTVEMECFNGKWKRNSTTLSVHTDGSRSDLFRSESSLDNNPLQQYAACNVRESEVMSEASGLSECSANTPVVGRAASPAPPASNPVSPSHLSPSTIARVRYNAQNAPPLPPPPLRSVLSDDQTDSDINSMSPATPR